MYEKTHNAGLFCRKCGISYPIFRKRLRGYNESGIDWLKDLSHCSKIFPLRKINNLYPTTLQKIFHSSVLSANINKNASVHKLRYSFAAHLIENGYDIRTVQELLGHSDRRTTMIYTHIAKKNVLEVISPVDDIIS